MTNNGRQIDVLFCDDVRTEVGGKKSLMGIYVGDMQVPQFPTRVSKFCIFATVSTPVSLPFQSMKVRVLVGEKIILDSEIPPAEIKKGQRPPTKDDVDEEDPVYMATIELAVAQLEIKETTKVRVHVETESEILKGRALKVTQSTKVAPRRPAQAKAGVTSTGDPSPPA